MTWPEICERIEPRLRASPKAITWPAEVVSQ